MVEGPRGKRQDRIGYVIGIAKYVTRGNADDIEAARLHIGVARGVAFLRAGAGMHFAIDFDD